MDDLFTAAGAGPVGPLAVRMRPRTAGEVVGQAHLLAPGSPLRRLLDPEADSGAAGPAALVLWGPPGTGKTTLAQLISSVSGRRFVEIIEDLAPESLGQIQKLAGLEPK